ncbi:uncharacterized protein YALI1_D06552g [Yarrowia lipolytica]|uniref:Uncharacterized protein n=1 Tax=Yarrowia lipolytica TaxID=4952 RepID=A0A1D8ND86_YARLL|nr:hypothetical protein YALI1_D06552g [Yarrowia lipolytica]
MLSNPAGYYDGQLGHSFQGEHPAEPLLENQLQIGMENLVDTIGSITSFAAPTIHIGHNTRGGVPGG